MTPVHDLPLWAVLLTSALLLMGSSLALIGSVGLLRFKSFYERVHAPTLGTTLGLFFIVAGSMLYFSIAQTRSVVHEVLIAVFVSTTTPVTFMLLVSAALYRDRFEGNDPLKGLSETSPRTQDPSSAYYTDADQH
ncbi:MAG: monovalent cation/H(+) antiporter subunit G [Hyphomicrobiaceae bacterium]